MEDPNTCAAEEGQPVQNLGKLVKQLVKEERYAEVAELLSDKATAERLGNVAMELFNGICLPNLKDWTPEGDFPLYCCAEELLRVIAQHGPPEELLLELLELTEECKSEVVFTSVLRAMQILLIRFGENKTRALEWSLNSIHTRLEELPLPPYLESGYDEKQARLLEQDPQIQTLLTHYVTVGLFCEPMLRDISAVQRRPQQIFRNTGLNRRNIMCCFLLNLLGKPLALLDLGDNKQNGNSYTIQCAKNLSEGVTVCIGDPFHFFAVVEYRMRWKGRIDYEKIVDALGSSNIFLVEEKLPITAVAIYYYMVLVRKVSLEKVPKVYHPLFVFEGTLYLANELLADSAPVLQYRAMEIVVAGLIQLGQLRIPAVSLELKAHKKFCEALCNVMIYSTDAKSRGLGLQILREYTLQFDTVGRYLIIQNLFKTVNHSGILGYLSQMYKDMVATALEDTAQEMASTLCGANFKDMVLECICNLPDGETTDLIEHTSRILPTLNVIRFFAITDKKNRTGFWQLVAAIDQQYLEPIRKGLDISEAHYKAELLRVEKGLNAKEIAEERTCADIMSVNVANAKTAKEKNLNLEVGREEKIDVLQRSICALQLTRSILGRIYEILQLNKKCCTV